MSEPSSIQHVADAIARLAALEPEAYDLVRKDEAASLNIRLGTLDKRVSLARKPIPKPQKTEAPTKPRKAAEQIPNLSKYFTPLGEADQRFYFLSSKTQRIMYFNSRDLRSGNGPRDLIPDENFWLDTFGVASSRPGWAYIGDYLVNACYKAGYFSVSKIRARGVWLDETRVVAHLGEEVWLDGKAISPIEMVPHSKFIYPLQQPLVEVNKTPALTDEEGKSFVNLCRKLAWRNKKSGDLLAGLIATGHICGALKFRTHGWLTGPTHSGKTWVMREVVMKALGSVAINVLGNSTEAGIRQEVAIDARPVVYDEAEGRGQIGKVRREFIIELMRAASAETDGQVLKGGAGHKAHGFRIKTQFILASIGVGLTERADETRTLILTLENPFDGKSKADAVSHFNEIETAAHALGDNFAAKMFRRMVEMVPIVRKNAQTFRDAIAKIKDGRTGDQIGTVMAGMAALESRDILTESAVDEIIKNFSWETYTAPDDEKDESSLLSQLASWPLSVETDKSRITRSIGELIKIVISPDPDAVIGARSAKTTLERHGLKIGDLATDGAPTPILGLWISNTHREVVKIMSQSSYPQGFHRILARVPGARKTEDPMRFAGAQSRATWIPLEEFIDT